MHVANNTYLQLAAVVDDKNVDVVNNVS